MVPDFAAGPVASCQAGERRGASLLWWMAGDIEGRGRDFIWLARAGALNDNETACPGQVSLQRFEGVNAYRAFIEASV